MIKAPVPQRRTVLRSALAGGCTLILWGCGNCLNFVAGSNTCKVVEGQVSPEGWCIFWAKTG